MADFPHIWIEIPGSPYQISEPLKTPRGEWLVATKFGELHWKSVFAPTRGSSIFRAVEMCEADTEQALATIAAGERPIAPAPAARLATEPTQAGLQYVMPGCEKDQSRGPTQMSLF